MRSTFYGLEIAKTGLFVSRNEMDITGHNISNVDTVGYTRQRLSTEAIPAAQYGSFLKPDLSGLSGKGVRTIRVDQVRNPFLDIQYRKESATAAKWSMQEQYFGYVEALFNNELDNMETSTGLSGMFGNLYSSLDKLAQGMTPDSEMRTNVRVSAESLISSLHYTYGRLVEQQQTLDQTVEVTVGYINDYAKEIAALNEQIFSYELSGAKANDLRDQRNLLVDELAEIVDITYNEDGNGYYSIELDGQYLVRHTQYKTLATDKTLANPAGGTLNNLNEIYWADSKGNPTSKKVEVRDGALYGYLQVRDGNSDDNYGIPHVVNKLNSLAQMIVTEFNAIHEKGWTMPYTDPATGTTTASRTGVKFFDDMGDVTQVTAGNISLSQDIKDSVYNIAASDVEVAQAGEENEQRGNNLIANELCQLLTRKDAAGNDDNFDGVYTEIVTGIATAQNHFNTLASSQTVVATQVDEQRKSVSGVSLDEEMTNVVRFGHAYNAASRVITAIDEELDVLINKMGLVGRA